jgi:pimeloyl-ACP methyl ester carboxylesterase
MASGGIGISGREEIAPCFFGDESLRLYGCLHPPVVAPADEAVLLCSATAHEYERCHRAHRQLAVQFARAGRYVLRFDYSGTGDSMGEYAHATLAQWRRDIGAAAAECRRRSGRARLCLVGMRLGATLAAQAAAHLDGVTSLVLYAPAFDGARLLADWQREQRAFDGKFSYTVARAAHELLGFPLTGELRAGLDGELQLPPPAASLRRVLLLSEGACDETTRRAASLLGSAGAAVTLEQAEGPAIWRREPLEAIVPFGDLRRIVAWAKQPGP